MAMNPEIWRYIFDSIEDPVFLHDAQFRVTMANRAYCRAAGMTESEVLGNHYWDIFPQCTGPLPGCMEAATGKSHTGSREEVRVGEKRFISLGYTVHNEHGESLYSLHILSDITLQRQTELALAESTEVFHSIFDTARDAIVTLDGDSGVVTTWNPAAEAIFGYSKEEMIGRKLHEVLAPSRFLEAAHAGMKLFATIGDGAAVGKTLELAAIHKNGTEFPIELSLSAVNIRGKWFASGIVRDITERKRAAGLLKNLEANYRSMFESSSDAIMLLNETGFFDCNEATLRIFGCPTREQFISKSPAKFSPPTQPGGENSTRLANEQIAKAYKNSSNQFEWMHRRLDGTDFAAEVLLTAIKLDGKAVLQAAVRDISERKRTEEALRYSEQRFHDVTNAAGEYVWEIDANKVYTYVSDQSVYVKGYTPEELLGHTPLEFMPMEDIDPSGEIVNYSIANKTPFKLQHRDITKSGEVLWEEVNGVPFYDENGGVLGLRGTGLNITERKRTETKLAEQLNELQRWNDAMQGREERILTLKHEVNELLGQAGLPLHYPSAESKGQQDE
jgi:PAS domain S-box-containing protein